MTTSTSTGTRKIYEKKEGRKENMVADLESVILGLAQGGEDAAKSEAFLGWLRTMSKFHKYSYSNCMMISMQCPGASRVAGFRAWIEKFGRKVRKGESAIWILAPMMVKSKIDPNEKTCIGFKPVPVFDVSQTDPIEGATASIELNYGSECDDDEKIDRALDHLEAFAASRGIVIDTVSSGVLGIAEGCSKGGKICILDTLSKAQRAGTMAHELAHELLHWEDGKHLSRDHSMSWREVEAESVSYAVMQSFGIDQASELYLAAWGGTLEIAKKSMGRITKAAHEILAPIVH